MISAEMRVCPQNMTPNTFAQQWSKWIGDQLNENYDSYESYNVEIVTPESFDELWEVQETYKKTPEIKEKYSGIAKEGRLVYAEIDY